MIKASKHLTLQCISTKSMESFTVCDIIELKTLSCNEVHISTEHSCHCSNFFFCFIFFKCLIPLFFYSDKETKSCYTNQAHAFCDFV